MDITIMATPFTAAGLMLHLIEEHGWDSDEESDAERALWTAGDWREAHEAEHLYDADSGPYLEHGHPACEWCPTFPASFLDVEGQLLCSDCHGRAGSGMAVDTRPMDPTDETDQRAAHYFAGLDHDCLAAGCSVTDTAEWRRALDVEA